MFSLFRQWVNGWLESQASFLEQQWSGLARVKQASIRGRRQDAAESQIRGLPHHDCMTTVQLNGERPQTRFYTPASAAAPIPPSCPSLPTES